MNKANNIGRPVVLTIAGFDPSSGAGLTADLKVIEQLRCYGLALNTGNTVQNDVQFDKVEWTNSALLQAQLQLLLQRFTIDVVKVGIVENWSTALTLIELVKAQNRECKVILDPVLNATASIKSSWHLNNDSSENNPLVQLLEQVDLITPNREEIKVLFSDIDPEDQLNTLLKHCSVLLKGGHAAQNSGKKGQDQLFTKNKTHYFNPKNNAVTAKHGSGCILSTAIAAYLAKGEPLFKACYKGKKYTEEAMSSNNSLLAYHH